MKASLMSASDLCFYYPEDRWKSAPQLPVCARVISLAGRARVCIRCHAMAIRQVSVLGSANGAEMVTINGEGDGDRKLARLSQEGPEEQLPELKALSAQDAQLHD
jgi:hypothetical protein